MRRSSSPGTGERQPRPGPRDESPGTAASAWSSAPAAAAVVWSLGAGWASRSSSACRARERARGNERREQYREGPYSGSEPGAAREPRASSAAPNSDPRWSCSPPLVTADVARAEAPANFANCEARGTHPLISPVVEASVITSEVATKFRVPPRRWRGGNVRRRVRAVLPRMLIQQTSGVSGRSRITPEKMLCGVQSGPKAVHEPAPSEAGRAWSLHSPAESPLDACGAGRHHPDRTSMPTDRDEPWISSGRTHAR